MHLYFSKHLPLYSLFYLSVSTSSSISFLGILFPLCRLLFHLYITFIRLRSSPFLQVSFSTIFFHLVSRCVHYIIRLLVFSFPLCLPSTYTPITRPNTASIPSRFISSPLAASLLVSLHNVGIVSHAPSLRFPQSLHSFLPQNFLLFTPSLIQL